MQAVVTGKIDQFYRNGILVEANTTFYHPTVVIPLHATITKEEVVELWQKSRSILRDASPSYGYNIFIKAHLKDHIKFIKSRTWYWMRVKSISTKTIFHRETKALGFQTNEAEIETWIKAYRKLLQKTSHSFKPEI